MKIQFTDNYLELLANKKTETGKQKFSEEVIKSFRKQIFQIKHAISTQELRKIKSLHFEKLKEKRYKGKHSIRLHGKYRLIFGINKQRGVEIILIEEISDHYS